MTTLRSVVFLVGGVLITAVFGILVPLGGFHFPLAARIARFYGQLMLGWATLACGIRYEVRGWENVPKDTAVILMAKHQSAWETIFMDACFPPQCWIVKRELLWLPFVGWGLMAIRCIAIDRSSGRSARDQIVEQGSRRLAQGIWVSIFPEGTRVAPGQRGRYGLGGAMLAAKSGAPILPIAHNAGEFWPRYAFRKRAGTITVVIGPLIPTAGRDAASINADVEAWIEGRMREISPERYAHA